MEKKEYHNELPPGYKSWTQFFIELNLASTIHSASQNPDIICLVFEVSKLSKKKDWVDGKLMVDLEFIKVRLFDEFFASTQLTRESCMKLVQIADNHLGDSPSEELDRALYELLVLAEIIYRTNETPPPASYRILD